MSRSHELLKALRKIHLYFGVFIAPALLFFAFSGVMQTFSLHERTSGSSYSPPAWAVKLGQLHKKQTLVVSQRQLHPELQGGNGDHMKPPQGGKSHATEGGAPASGGGGQKPADQSQKPTRFSHLPMKIFFLIVGVGLFTEALTGIYMSYKFARGKWVITALLVAGTIVPLLLLHF